MEFSQLKSFVKIADTGNLRKAASLLFISQSALSSQIKLLEANLELKLFRRSAKGMELTDNGRILYSHAMDIISCAEKFDEKARELTGRVSRAVRVGINTDGHFLQVGKLSRILKSQFPETNFFFVASQTIRTAEMLRDDLLDIGFYFGEMLEYDITSTLLSHFDIRIVIPRRLLAGEAATLQWSELAGLPWIWSVCDCPFYGIIQRRMAEQNLEPNRFVDAMDESVVRELIMAGQGVGILREDDARYVAALAQVDIWPREKFSVPLRLGMLKQNQHKPMFGIVAGLIEGLWRS